MGLDLALLSDPPPCTDTHKVMIVQSMRIAKTACLKRGTPRNNNSLTWLNKSDVEDLFDMPVVSSDLEDGFGNVLDARDVDGHHVVRDLRPTHLVALDAHLEDLRPKPAK